MSRRTRSVLVSLTFRFDTQADEDLIRDIQAGVDLTEDQLAMILYAVRAHGEPSFAGVNAAPGSRLLRQLRKALEANQ